MNRWRRRWPWGLALAFAVLGVCLLLARPDAPRTPPKHEDARATPLRRLAVLTSGTASVRGPAWQGLVDQLQLAPPAAGHSAECARDAVPAASAGLPTEDGLRGQPEAVARLVARLRDSADPVSQAVSLLVGDISAWEPEQWRRQRDQVARAAQLTTDPRLYELSLRACDRLRADVPDPQDACSGLNRGRLLQLDPDNAAVWVRQVADADARHADAEAAEALYRASVATRYRSWEPMAARVVAEAMKNERPEDRYAVLKALGDTRSLLTQGLFLVPLIHQCSKDQVVDANRRQVCERVANVLLDHSNSPDSTLLGLGIGWQLGRTEEEMAPYVERNQMLMNARLAMPDTPKADCMTATTWTPVLQASFDESAPWAALSSALADRGWSADRLKQRAEAVQRAASEANAAKTARAEAPAATWRGRVEVLGGRF